MRGAKLIIPLILAVGAALVAISAHDYRKEHARLMADPVTATAIVVDNHVETVQTPGKNTSVERHHIVRYRFTPASGAEIANEVSFPSDAYEAIKPGAELQVVYAKDEPKLHAFPTAGVLVSGEETFLASTGDYGYAISGALAALAALWLVVGSRRRSRTRS